MIDATPHGIAGVQNSLLLPDAMLLFNVVLNRIKQQFELLQAELKITFDVFRVCGSAYEAGPAFAIRFGD